MVKHIVQDHLHTEHFGIDGSDNITRSHEYGKFRLSVPEPIVCTLSDTWYKITGTWTDDGQNNGFTTDDANDRIISNTSEKTYELKGVSDVEVDAACTMIYGLFINGSESGKNTPHDFNVVSNTENISIIDFIDVKLNDYFEVWVKTDKPNLTVTPNTLTVLFKW